MGNFERNALEVHFEKVGDDYFYYPTARGGGVRVSAEERETYLSGSPLAAMRWAKNIAERPQDGPPRTWVQRQRKGAKSPLGNFAPLFVVFGAVLLILAFTTETATGQVIFATLSALSFYQGLITVYFRWFD